ncbi:MAG: GntR family transcriptional regulator [Firmicutes bacterium]|nr:GntR family transcriptional regulator [Bacillota bacterium]
MGRRLVLPIDFQLQFRTAHGIVLDRLREAIVSGVLKPGERLMEMQLAEDLGVSRTPVREAMRKLELEGFVHTIPRKGIFVVDYTDKDIVDTFKVRLALEVLAVELAVPNITDEDIEKLIGVLEEEAESIENKELEDMVRTDERFHDIILQASGNRQLLQIVVNLREQINRFRFVSVGGRGRSEEVLVEHRLIMEGLSSGDVELAAERTAEHINNTQQALLAAIKRREDQLKDGYYLPIR